jgi:hypothetical protein
MRDPYDILGVARGATFEEVRAAYRKACKTKHPDMGGSHQEFVELQAAYEHILRDLKRGYQQRREGAPRQEHAHSRQESADTQSERRWEKTARDIEEELEELRRNADAAARAHEEALRARRAQAWQSGEHGTWARLTWQDLARFFTTIARSGLKGLSLLFAAVIGIGTVLVEANVVSAIVLAGSGIGFLLSHALKSDKGGLMSAGLLLFGLMTIWLPPVRAAVFLYPLATISVLLCLALIFKFAQQGGTVGLLTGGVLSLYVLGVIVADMHDQPRPVPARVPTPEATVGPPSPPSHPAAGISQPGPTIAARPEARRSSPPAVQAPIASAPEVAFPPRPSSPSLSAALPQVAPAPPPEPRVLLASEGAVLKFIAGMPYRLKIRSGHTAAIYATRGEVAFYSGEKKIGECTSVLVLRMVAATTPYQEVESSVRACGDDAIAQVRAVR